MDIDLNLETVVIPNRSEAVAEVIGPLTRADIKMLAVKEGRPDDAPIGLLKRLSNRHHALAQALAKGMTNWEAGLAAGYDENYVAILKADPTFANLVTFYIEKNSHDDQDLADLNRAAAKEFLHEMLDRLEDPAERKKLTFNQVLQGMTITGDRAGLAPATNVNHKHEHTIGMADRMQRARERHDRVIDITPKKGEAA